jgi:hypothetical protein
MGKVVPNCRCIDIVLCWVNALFTNMNLPENVEVGNRGLQEWREIL